MSSSGPRSGVTTGAVSSNTNTSLPPSTSLLPSTSLPPTSSGEVVSFLPASDTPASEGDETSRPGFVSPAAVSVGRSAGDATSGLVRASGVDGPVQGEPEEVTFEPPWQVYRTQLMVKDSPDW